jgi:hypothetical protein
MIHIISDPAPIITLDRAECIPLELKLNVSSKGHLWKHIGDILFDYGRNTTGAIDVIRVTREQYDFIKQLLASEGRDV